MRSPTQTETPLLIWEAAARIGRSPQTVRAWIRDGKLPARKLAGQSGAYLIDPADADTLAERLAVTP